jgi:hypothetical protein
MKPLTLSAAVTLVLAWPLAASAQVAKPAAPGDPPVPQVVNRVRYYPAPGSEEAMVGGKFTASNRSAGAGYEVLATIADKPRAGAWSELALANDRPYRWIRYEGPPGSHGAVAELEFYAGKRKLNGPGFGSVGDRQPGRSWNRAMDANPTTWFEGEAADGQFVGLDLLDRATARTPTAEPPAGEPTGPLTVILSTTTAGATIRYTLDGTLPSADGGLLYTAPLVIERTTTIAAAAFQEGLAPSPATYDTYLIGDASAPETVTFHLGNSLTATTNRFAELARTAGRRHRYVWFVGPGAWTNQLWGFKDGPRKEEWGTLTAPLSRIDHLTVQPRDFNIAEEAWYDTQFFNLLRKKSPDLQPWLYTEWVEKVRQRPSDKGAVPSYQMKTLYPALTWEESMSAMLLYVEELQHQLGPIDRAGKRPRVLPSALAMGWIKNMIDHGKLPGAEPGSFYPLLFRDQVHPNANGGYLVDMTWYAAFYRESPVGKVLPILTTLTAEQAAVMQQLAWDVIQNYPDCGLYEEGTTPVAPPEFTAQGPLSEEARPVSLSSSTPGTWFRYTLDGTIPTRTRGYVYCGVISFRPGMTLKAVAYKSGMADSPVAEWPGPAPRR